jgi:hypothetical protein
LVIKESLPISTTMNIVASADDLNYYRDARSQRHSIAALAP